MFYICNGSFEAIGDGKKENLNSTCATTISIPRVELAETGGSSH